jgi:hypothetical protein
MASNKQPDRWEATLLAAVMAVAGAPFLFDKLGSLVRTSILSLPAVSHLAPVLLAAVGAILVLADQDAAKTQSGEPRQKEGAQHEL